MKRRIKLFPDHMSSGLWDEETQIMVDVADLADGTLTISDVIALRYWHEVWEIVENAFNGLGPLSLVAFNRDGQALVDQWNSQQDVYEFIYVPEK